MNPILPTGVCGLNGGRGELLLAGDAVFTSTFTRWASPFDSSVAFFALGNKTKERCSIQYNATAEFHHCLSSVGDGAEKNLGGAPIFKNHT